MTASPPRPALVLAVGGFWRTAVTEAARHLLAGRPSLRVIDHPQERDPAEQIRQAIMDSPELLVLLPETAEPDRIRTEWRARLPEVPLHLITAVPADLVTTGLIDETALHEVGLQDGPGDNRGIGDVVNRQIEQADTVLLTGNPDEDTWQAEQVRTLLRRIAAWARVHDLAGSPVPATGGNPEPITPTIRGLRGRDVGVHDPAGSHSVVSCLFQARRPLHPVRLHAALDEITARVMRSRGHFWLANRPDLVMSWESAADVTTAPASVWLDTLRPEQWSGVHPERHLAASLDWDPYYGDRHHHLAFVGIDLDPALLHRTLAGCLLTDPELAEGEESWRQLPDPFTSSEIER